MKENRYYYKFYINEYYNDGFVFAKRVVTYISDETLSKDEAIKKAAHDNVFFSNDINHLEKVEMSILDTSNVAFNEVHVRVSLYDVYDADFNNEKDKVEYATIEAFRLVENMLNNSFEHKFSPVSIIDNGVEHKIDGLDIDYYTAPNGQDIYFIRIWSNDGYFGKLHRLDECYIRKIVKTFINSNL